MADLEVEYLRKDFRNATKALLLHNGVDVKPLMALGHKVQVKLNYNSPEQAVLPQDLLEWIETSYSPRQVGVKSITLGLSPIMEYQNFTITGVDPWAMIEAATFVPNTEEAIIAANKDVVMPDPGLFGLPVTQSISEAEQLMNWKGIIVPDELGESVLANTTILVLYENHFVWRRGAEGSLEDWLKNPMDKIKENETAIEPFVMPTEGKLQISIVRSLINHVLEVSRGRVSPQQHSFSKQDRDVSPRVSVSIF